MPSRKIPIVIALVAALSVAAWTSGGAAADRIEVASRATLAQSAPFHGEVLSRKTACERNRTVKVYRVDPGPDGLYGTTTSNAQGRWAIPAGLPNGEFYAIAIQRKVSTAKTTFVCKRAVSPKVAFS